MSPDVAGIIETYRDVPAQCWQAARPLGDWTLVTCVVAPASEFGGFELAPPGWQPGQ